MNNKVEVWKTYPKIEWLQGSNLGNARTLDHYVKDKRWGKRLIKGHVLKQYRTPNGYMYVTLKVNGKLVNLKVHRIIASCFLPNPDNLPQVNHKNCVRTDNLVENLEWCSRGYNIEYREKYGAACNSPVIAINLNTYEASRFPSQMEAARQLGAKQSAINGVLKGRRYKSTHGYWFTYANENTVDNIKAKFGDDVANKVSAFTDKKGELE